MGKGEMTVHPCGQKAGTIKKGRTPFTGGEKEKKSQQSQRESRNAYTLTT